MLVCGQNADPGILFDRCASRYDSLFDTNWGALSFTEGQCYVCGFVFQEKTVDVIFKLGL